MEWKRPTRNVFIHKQNTYHTVLTIHFYVGRYLQVMGRQVLTTLFSRFFSVSKITRALFYRPLIRQFQVNIAIPMLPDIKYYLKLYDFGNYTYRYLHLGYQRGNPRHLQHHKTRVTYFPRRCSVPGALTVSNIVHTPHHKRTMRLTFVTDIASLSIS